MIWPESASVQVRSTHSATKRLAARYAYDFIDGQIAAIAKIHNLTLITANPKHFAIFHSLTVANWSA